MPKRIDVPYVLEYCPRCNGVLHTTVSPFGVEWICIPCQRIYRLAIPVPPRSNDGHNDDTEYRIKHI